MVIYISGKITGLFDYKEKFDAVEEKLKKQRHTILSPMIFPLGLTYDNYLTLAYAMIDCCDAIYMLDNWQDSKGAKLEYEYASKMNKLLFYDKINENLKINK